jgi:hypothetical protein
MNSKPVIFACLLAASGCLASAASASTIYNELAVDLTVTGDLDIPQHPEHALDVPAAMQIGDLDWAHAYGVEVSTGDQLLCHFYWGFANRELTGDNYLVVYSRDRAVTCDLCSGSGNLLQFSDGRLPESVAPYDSPRRGCKLRSPGS